MGCYISSHRDRALDTAYTGNCWCGEGWQEDATLSMYSKCVPLPGLCFDKPPSFNARVIPSPGCSSEECYTGYDGSSGYPQCRPKEPDEQTREFWKNQIQAGWARYSKEQKESLVRNAKK